MSVVKDGGWGWCVTFASFVVHFVSGGVAYSAGVFFLILRRDFDSSAFMTSWPGAILMAMTTFGGVSSSFLVRRLGFRMTVVLGGGLAGCGLALSVLSQQLWHMYLTLGGLTGLGFGIALTPSVLVLDTYFYEKRALSASAAICGTSVGVAVIPLAVYHIDHHLAWKGVSLILAALSVTICLSGIAMRNDDKPESPRDSDYRRRRRAMDKIFMSHLLKSPSFHALLWSNFFWCVGISIFFTYIPYYAIRSGSDPESAVILISIVGLSTLLSRITFQMFSHSAKLDIVSSVLCTVALASILTGLFQEFFKHRAGDIGFAILLGLHSGYWTTCVASVSEDLIGTQFMAYGRGFICLSIGLGLLVGPPLAGLSYDKHDNQNISMYLSGACLLAGSIILVLTSLVRCYVRPPESWSECSSNASSTPDDNNTLGGADLERGAVFEKKAGLEKGEELTDSEELQTVTLIVSNNSDVP